MGHPLIDEFCRAHDFRPDFLRRCQREFREVQSHLDQREALLTENADLKAQLADAREQIATRTAKQTKKEESAKVSA
jgi:hypothetical protein